MHSEKWCAIVKDISYVLTCTMCSSFKKIYCEKGIACARGFIFDIEVDWDMTYFNGMLYRALPFYKRHALAEGSTHFKEMHHSFSRESFKVFEDVLTQGLSQECQYQNKFYTFIDCLCFCICSTPFLKNYINRQNCLICGVPSPPSFLQWYLHFAMIFYIVF